MPISEKSSVAPNGRVFRINPALTCVVQELLSVELVMFAICPRHTIGTFDLLFQRVHSSAAILCLTLMRPKIAAHCKRKKENYRIYIPEVMGDDYTQHLVLHKSYNK